MALVPPTITRLVGVLPTNKNVPVRTKRNETITICFQQKNCARTSWNADLSIVTLDIINKLAPIDTERLHHHRTVANVASFDLIDRLAKSMISNHTNAHNKPFGYANANQTYDCTFAVCNNLHLQQQRA